MLRYYPLTKPRDSYPMCESCLRALASWEAFDDADNIWFVCSSCLITPDGVVL
jgi:hypothetical protein